MARDITLFENGSGGELLILNNDLSLIESIFQQVYLHLFGGNIEANTTGSESPSEQRFDWWGNTLFYRDTPTKQFNSNTERTLHNVALNTSGRIDIQRAVEFDLKNLTSVANVTVNVVILSHAKLEINVGLQMPEEIQDKTLQFIWDNAADEIIIGRII